MFVAKPNSIRLSSSRLLTKIKLNLRKLNDYIIIVEPGVELVFRGFYNCGGMYVISYCHGYVETHSLGPSSSASLTLGFGCGSYRSLYVIPQKFLWGNCGAEWAIDGISLSSSGLEGPPSRWIRRMGDYTERCSAASSVADRVLS